MRLAIYAHFDADAQVTEHVFHHLRSLRQLGLQVYFVSNSPIPADRIAELELICLRVFQRANVGYDFAMWQHAIHACDLAEVDELLLTNSSIIGPLHPMQSLWEDARGKDWDFWGLTGSDDFALHIQSYFLVFTRKVIASDCFCLFWNSVLPFADKNQIIRSYEVGLTVWLTENGFKSGVLFPDRQTYERFKSTRNPVWWAIQEYRFRAVQWFWRRRYGAKYVEATPRKRSHYWGLNSSVHFADILIEDGMPFLKASVLQHGYWGIPQKTALGLITNTLLPASAVAELRKKYGIAD